MPTLNKIHKIFAVFLLSSCSLASMFETKPQSITTTESIFLDTNPDTQITFIMTDSILPNLKTKIANELKQHNIKIAANYSSANVVLKVKTRFSGKILKKDLGKLLEEEASFASVSNFEIKEKPRKEQEEKTTIDRLVEDPSGMIAGFAIGAAMSNPIVTAPIGMVAGSVLNFTIGSIFGQKEFITILDIEIHEKTPKPIWFTEKRLHQKDEYSIRKYEYSQETNWKIYKTRIIANGSNQNLEKNIASLVL